MNYRSILKEFDQSIVAENKKLMETYNKLLKESEDVCPKCKKSPCVCDKEEVTECGDQVQEDDMLKDREHNLHISAKKFFENEDDVADNVTPVKEGKDKEIPDVTSDETVTDNTETVDEDDDNGNLVSAEEFFGKADNSDDATDDTDDTSKETEPVEKTGDDEEDTSKEIDPVKKTGDDEEEKVDEASKTMIPSSLFEDEEKKDEEKKPVEGDEKKEEVKEPDEVDQKADKSKDKAEFFAEECNKKEEKNEEPVEKVDENCKAEKKDDEKKEEVTEEVEDKEEENKDTVEESEEDEEMTDSEKEMKELQESMDAVKMFVKANKRFFPVNG